MRWSFVSVDVLLSLTHGEKVFIVVTLLRPYTYEEETVRSFLSSESGFSLRRLCEYTQKHIIIVNYITGFDARIL